MTSSSHLCIVVWTDSGQLIQITNTNLSGFPVIKPHIITTIPMQDRSKYRIVEGSDSNFSLVKSDDAKLKITDEHCFYPQSAIENAVYRKDELPVLKRMLYEAYRFVINRPFKLVGISCIGLSFLLYMRHLKRR